MDSNLKHILSDVDVNKFAEILNQNALICVFNLHGDFSYVSQAFCALLGYSSSQLLTHNIDLLDPRKPQKEVLINWPNIFKKNKKWSGNIHFLSSKGNYLELEAHMYPIKDFDGLQELLCGVFKFNSDPLDFQDYIEKDSSYNSFFINSPVPKSLYNLKTLQYVDVNKAWENYTGFKKNKVLNQTPKKIKFHDLYNLEFMQKLQSAEEESFKIDKAMLTIKPDEKKFAILNYEKININEETFLLEIITDITEQIKYQEKLKTFYKKSVEKKDVILKLAGLVGCQLNDIFEKITMLAAKTSEIGRVSIWKFNDKGTELICQNAYNLKQKKHIKEVQFKTIEYPEYFHSLFTNKTLKTDDALNDIRTSSFAEKYLKPLGITSTLDVLILGHYGYYGVLSFEHIGIKKKWNAEDEEFATSISNIISLAVVCDERNNAEIKLIKNNEKLLDVNLELSKLKKELEQENTYLREEIDLVFNYEEMVYGSAAFSQVLTEVEQVANTTATVLLLGESGTGKELIARAIHNISGRKNKPLIKVNCAAIPRELIESELFGHKKGSFTGAIKDKLGKFQLADGGTLFLDEIGELPMEMQPKLLRAIQESEIEQIGGTEAQKVDIRIIAATNRDLEKEIKEKNFREDLFFRINVFPITIPPLRERVEDIPILIEHFVNKFSKLYSKNIKYISDVTKSNLQTYSWPGNIRELENLIERAVILSNNNTLNIPNFKSSEKESLISSTVLSLDDVQRNYIKKILKKCHWKIDGPKGAAELLHLKPSTLRDRIRKLDIKKS
ncbi:MAG: sigma 54-interacting transcriptional regulator [Xanthomarina sp.]